MALEVVLREGAEKVIMNMVNNFCVRDRGMVACTQKDVELPPARGN
jgi:hypothetical protein